MHGWHILLQKQGGAWAVTGHIDLGDAEVGPVEYEWVSIGLKSLRSEPAALRAFFEACGISLPLDDATRQRLKVYTLLHRFTHPARAAERAGMPRDAPTLDAFLDSLWPA